MITHHVFFIFSCCKDIIIVGNLSGTYNRSTLLGFGFVIVVIVIVIVVVVVVVVVVTVIPVYDVVAITFQIVVPETSTSTKIPI